MRIQILILGFKGLIRHAREANAFRAMLTVSDRIQIPSKTTHKDKGTKINAFHYFISKYSVRVSWDLTYKKRTPDRILSRETVPSREFRQTMASSEKPWAQAARTKNF